MANLRHLTDSAATDAAASWALRLDAGLTPAEKEELDRWLAADPGHATALAEARAAWTRFGPLADELATRLPMPAARPARLRRIRWTVPVLAAAAAIAFGITLWRRDPPASAPATAPAALAILPPPCVERALDDGTVVTCNRGGEVVVAFTPAERRVELRRGEAHFAVAKDPARPFIVSVGGRQIRAVGTAFNVKLEAAAVDVLVTEGRVRIDSASDAGPAVTDRAPGTAATTDPRTVSPVEAPTLSAGQNLVLPLGPVASLSPVRTLSAAQIGAKLAWQPRILSYDDVPLAEIVAEFNRCNPVRLVVDGERLRALRLTASFRSDNVQGFVRLLAANYGVKSRPNGRGEIELRRDD